MAQIHFLSGLPRSGSTLLAAILRQNPSFHASISSPLAQMFAALQQQMSEANEASIFLTDEKRRRLLQMMIMFYYAGDVPVGTTIIDTNRLWTAKTDILFRLFPDAKMVVMVRNLAWILDSIERLARKNNLYPSKMFGNNASGNVYSRARQVMGEGGMVGYAYNCTREAFFGDNSGRLLFVQYDTLVKMPRETIVMIADFLHTPINIPSRIEQIPLAAEFDAKLGMPGLHTVGERIEYKERETILPPDLFRQHAATEFWNMAELNTRGVKVI